MTREALNRASEAVKTASELASTDVRERLAAQVDQLNRIASADRGPDHGRLARHEHILSQIAEEEGNDVAVHLDEALDAIRSYRETLPGV